MTAQPQGLQFSPFHPSVSHAASWKCLGNRTVKRTVVSQRPTRCVCVGGSEPPCSGFLISKEHPHSLAVHTVHRDRQSPPHCKPMSKKEVSIHTWEMWAYHGGGALSKWEFWVDENERTAIMLSSTLLSQRWGRGRGVHSFSPVSLQIILVNKIREALISKFS